MTLLILGGLAWIYALSVVFAESVWARIFEGFANEFDLTYAQVILLIPGIPVAFCVLTGIASVIFLVKTIRAGNLFSASFENLAGLVCLSAFLFYAVLDVRSASTFVQIVSTAQGERTHRTVYETGQVRDGRYENHSYGFYFQMPVGWNKASWATFERKKLRATFQLFSLWGRTTALTNYVPEHVDGIDTLAAILKHVPETEGYNPSLVINANDKQLMSEKYGITNLLGVAMMHSKAPPPFVVDQWSKPVAVGNQIAIKLNITSTRNGVLINQTVFAFETGSTYLEFVASAVENDDLSNLVVCVKSVKFMK
jgi:hypothetical protein